MWSDGQSGSASMYEEHFDDTVELKVQTRCIDDESVNWSEEQRKNCFIKIIVTK